MRKFNFLFLLFLSIIVISTTNCKKDTETLYQLMASAIDDTDYSGDGILAFAFSVDNGTTWSPNLPVDLKVGATVKVKITDGTNDLTADKFEFDWSASSGTLSSTTTSMVDFTVESTDIKVAVKVSEIMELVVVKRADGKLFKVNKTTGDLTEIIALVKGVGGPALTGMRSMVYDPLTGLGFLGGTNNASAGFYSLNIKTGVATLLNGNDPDDRDGISGLLMAADGNVMANFYSGAEGFAIATFNKTTGVLGPHYGMSDGKGSDIYSYGGIMYGSTSSQLVLGGENEIYFSNLTATISDTTVLVPSTNISSNMKVFDLQKDKKTGIVYSIIFDYDNTGYLFLATVNTATGVITEIKQLADATQSNWYHCLAFVPKHRLP